MENRGHLIWPSQGSGQQAGTLCACDLAELLRDSAKSDKIKCNRLILENVRLIGPLDLSGAGKLGAPVIPLEMRRCRFQGGIDTSHAYLQGLVLQDCSLEPIEKDELTASCFQEAPSEMLDERSLFATVVGRKGEPPRLRFTGATISEKVEVKRQIAPPETILDFSHTTLEHGCELDNVGVWHEMDYQTGLAKDPGFMGISCITFAGATITGGLTLAGARVHAKQDDGRALNCAEMRLQGSLNFCSSPETSCHFIGEVNLVGAIIRGEVRSRGICMVSLPWRQSLPDPPLTVAASGLTLSGSLLLWNEGHVGAKADLKQKDGHCTVFGQIDMSGAHIGGDLQFAGHYQAYNHTRILNAQSTHIGGDVRFGWILGGDRTFCNVIGEVDFSNSQIEGKFVVSGSNHSLVRPVVGLATGSDVCDAAGEAGSRAPQRWAKFAIKLVGTTVHNNVVLQGANKKHCTVEGLALTGATIGGQLVIEGVTLQAVDEKSVAFRKLKSRKAISANGATIRGGIYVSVEAEVPRTPTDNPLEQDEHTKPQPTTILGDVRLRNATVNGPVLFRGVTMTSSDQHVAFWASGTNFGSDVVFMPTKNSHMVVNGEVRIWGSNVQGNLKFEGVELTALETGSALDASLVTVVKAVYIGKVTKAAEPTGQKSIVRGLINLNFLSCSLLTIGADPPARSVENSPRDTSSLELTGAILLREARVKGPVIFSELLLAPCEEASMNGPAVRRLKELAITLDRLLIYAVYAELGTRLFVRLNKRSSGLITLYGAKTGTIGALRPAGIVNGINIEAIDEDWGEKPQQLYRWRAGKPAPKAGPCITLNLDEFRYSRLFDRTEKDSNDKEEVAPLRRLRWGLIGRPSPDAVLPRYGWLRHQVSNPGMPNELVTWPYRQLAKVYRDTGDLKRAYVYERERRWMEIQQFSKGGFQAAVDSFFGFLFGFGYSSPRAATWLVLWFVAFVIFLYRWGIPHVSQSCIPLDGATFYNSLAEALRLLIPDSLKVSALSNACTATGVYSKWKSSNEGQEMFFFFLAFFRFFGRLLVLGATLTFTGVLQEKAPVALSVKD